MQTPVQLQLSHWFLEGILQAYASAGIPPDSHGCIMDIVEGHLPFVQKQHGDRVQPLLGSTACMW